jgi:hypothetical protein
MLELTLQLRASTFTTLLKYVFALSQTPLERLDVIASQVQDVDDKVTKMVAAVDALVAERRDTLAMVQLVSSDNAYVNQAFEFKLAPGFALEPHFSMDNGRALTVDHGGVYMIVLDILVLGQAGSFATSISVNDVIVRTHCHYHPVANQIATSSTSTLLTLQTGDVLMVTSTTGTGNYAAAGSVMVVIQLR